MVRMPPLPVGQNNYARPRLANHARHLQPVLPRILYAAVGKIERPSPTDSQNLTSVVGLPGTIFCRAARSHFTLGQIQNARSLPALPGLKQRAAAGLLYVVPMSCDGQNIER